MKALLIVAALSMVVASVIAISPEESRDLADLLQRTSSMASSKGVLNQRLDDEDNDDVVAQRMANVLLSALTEKNENSIVASIMGNGKCISSLFRAIRRCKKSFGLGK